MAAKLSVLVASRKNSKYLAKFLFGLIKNTNSLSHVEVLVMMNEHDTWNQELVDYYRQGFGPDNQYHFQFFTEDLKLGRDGLHEYFNDLAKHATGDWSIEHTINGRLMHGDSAGKDFPLDPAVPHIIVPQFDNCGAMNHIVSRGFVKALGGRIGNHGWIDSYINDLCAATWRKHDISHIIRMDKPMFHDFTHDIPGPMSPEDNKTEISPVVEHMPKHDSPAYRAMIERDAQILMDYRG
jgi:hypothetical protein